MTRCPPGCALCGRCPVAQPHYCDHDHERRERAHAKWLAFNERFRHGMGLGAREAEPEYRAPETGIVDLCAWGEFNYRVAARLALHAVDLAAVERAEQAVAKLAPPHAEALWAAYVERGDREDMRPAPGRGRVQTGRPLPLSLPSAERAFMREAKALAATASEPDPGGLPEGGVPGSSDALA